MKYIVIFFEEYVGCHFDEYTKVFTDKAEAERYKNKLNEEYAKANDCPVEYLGDYYIVEKVKS